MSLCLTLKALLHLLTQISWCRKPEERTSEICLEMISLVGSTDFPQQLDRTTESESGSELLVVGPKMTVGIISVCR